MTPATAPCKPTAPIFTGLYFSILSTFHIGWRDLNAGNWITRIQSLISVYLLALWALTYFGRPFE